MANHNFTHLLSLGKLMALRMAGICSKARLCLEESILLASWLVHAMPRDVRFG
jgi:hypothetical protein